LSNPLERFDGDGHALFVDDPLRFNHMLEQFVRSFAELASRQTAKITGLLSPSQKRLI